ncbi:MAG: bifunctional methylenetetrahydrofolate dehydrogenase/methenyltetrahydrofolate cyclohydrolase FolD [Pseudomonadota bacterium]
MSEAQLIDGKAIAADTRRQVADNVAALKRDHGLKPGLAVVLVGEDPASQVYVRNKGKQTIECGMASIEHKLPADTSETALLELVGELNRADDVHGILVQLPLPNHIDPQKVIAAIDPEKDVDGFHPVNVGRLSIGERAFVPCTPAGSVVLIDSLGRDIAGMNAVVIGRSNIVGKPMAQLLLQRNCTVTIAHSRTQDLPGVVRAADLVVAAVGRPEFVKGDWIKPGAIVIDVGINRIETDGGKGRLVGDVAFDEAAKVAGAITPVPGGVGPMTIACLLKNTVESAKRTVEDGPPAS